VVKETESQTYLAAPALYKLDNWWWGRSSDKFADPKRLSSQYSPQKNKGTVCKFFHVYICRVDWWITHRVDWWSCWQPFSHFCSQTLTTDISKDSWFCRPQRWFEILVSRRLGARIHTLYSITKNTASALTLPTSVILLPIIHHPFMTPVVQSLSDL
jgi:hypothetical protein